MTDAESARAVIVLYSIGTPALLALLWLHWRDYWRKPKTFLIVAKWDSDHVVKQMEKDFKSKPYPGMMCCAHIPKSGVVGMCSNDATHLTPVAEYPLCDDHRDMKPCLKCTGYRCATGACGHDPYNILPWPDQQDND